EETAGKPPQSQNKKRNANDRAQPEIGPRPGRAPENPKAVSAPLHRPQAQRPRRPTPEPEIQSAVARQCETATRQPPHGLRSPSSCPRRATKGGWRYWHTQSGAPGPPLSSA